MFMLHSSLLHETVQLAIDDRVLILNSAADPFVLEAAQRLSAGELILAEDNLASLQQFNKLVGADLSRPTPIYRPQLRVRHVPFHEYTLHEAPATIDVVILNMLYQPSNAWMIYGLQIAAYALNPGGRLYVVGAKDRGVLSIAKRMQSLFGNLETLIISKGQRVVCSHIENNSLDQHAQEGLPHTNAMSDAQNVVAPLAGARPHTNATSDAQNVMAPLAGARLTNLPDLLPTTFAEGKLDEGTRLLVDALEVHA